MKALTHDVVARAPELRRHAKADLVGQREHILTPEAPVERFLVVEGVLHVACACLRPVLLPAAVGHHAVGAVELPLPPAPRAGEGEPVYVQAHLWDRAGVDAQAQGAAAQLAVLHLHGLLLGAYGQAQALPGRFGVGLLDEQAALMPEGQGHIKSVAQLPSPCGVVLQGACQLGVRHQRMGLHAAHAVAVGSQPQRRVVTRGGGSHGLYSHFSTLEALLCTQSYRQEQH